MRYITSQLLGCLLSKRQEIINDSENVEKRKLVHCWWQRKLYSHYRKQYGDSSNKQNKKNYHMIQQSKFWV